MKLNLNETPSINEEIYDLLAAIAPYDEMEKNTIADTLSWIESGAQIFRLQKPDYPKKHLGAYFILYDEPCQKVLLVDHKKAKLWLPPGGHVEPDEHPTETVKRECVEELAVEADFWMPDPLFLTTTIVDEITGHTDVNIWYVLKGDSCASYQFDQVEFNGIRWFGLDEIAYEQSEQYMRKFIEKLKSNTSQQQ